ncbi:OpgC domain-containing protein, partial [Mycobacterium tuberculosis]|nr:OpgC domain-containing protein [Mycobacterium tuberculosis]
MLIVVLATSRLPPWLAQRTARHSEGGSIMQTDLVPFLLRGRRALPAGTAKPKRDVRIDFVRGLALMIIFINHMPGNVVSKVMPHAYG